MSQLADTIHHNDELSLSAHLPNLIDSLLTVVCPITPRHGRTTAEDAI